MKGVVGASTRGVLFLVDLSGALAVATVFLWKMHRLVATRCAAGNAVSAEPGQGGQSGKLVGPPLVPEEGVR